VAKFLNARVGCAADASEAGFNYAANVVRTRFLKKLFFLQKCVRDSFFNCSVKLMCGPLIAKKNLVSLQLILKYTGCI
jgi:hypothetical protein